MAEFKELVDRLRADEEIEDIGDAIDAIETLEAELQKARNRWEQEVRERLDRVPFKVADRFNYLAQHSSAPGAWRAASQEFNVMWDDTIRAIFGEAEPVEPAEGHDFKLAEACPTCGEPVDDARIDERIVNVRFNHPGGRSATAGITLPLALKMAEENGGSVDVYLSDHGCWFRLVEGSAWRIQTLRAALPTCQPEAEPVESEDDRGALADPDAAEGEGRR